MGKLKDLTGQRFGKLVVIKVSGRDRFRHIIWECLCDCGKTSFPLGTSLVTGKTNSCGCEEFINAPRNQFISKINPGWSFQSGRVRLRTIYEHMIKRCYVPKTDSYPVYGVEV